MIHRLTVFQVLLASMVIREVMILLGTIKRSWHLTDSSQLESNDTKTLKDYGELETLYFNEWDEKLKEVKHGYL